MCQAKASAATDSATQSTYATGSENWVSGAKSQAMSGVLAKVFSLIARVASGNELDTERNRQKRGQEPQPPPQRAPLPLHHLVSAKPAEAIERASYAAASRALVQLQPAMGAALFLRRMVEQHRRLVAARAQARRNQRQRWKLQISVTTGITIGRRRVCL